MPWVEKTFSALCVDELYAALALRQRVFVLEQQCLYPDLDGADLAAWHLWLPWAAVEAVAPGDGATGSSRGLAALAEPDRGVAAPTAPAAYLRILPPGTTYAEASLGRIVVAPALRGRGLGAILVREGMARARGRFGAAPLRIGAQAHLQAFYTDLGFAPVSEPYLEDGIWHVEMLAAGGGAG